MSFVSNAFLEIILLGALSGIVGVLACLRQRVFYTQALTHATFPGAILGVVCVTYFFDLTVFSANTRADLLSMGIFLGAGIMCLPMIFFMNLISKVKGQGSHTAAGILLTVGFALGFLLLKLFQPLPIKVSTFIAGNVLTSNMLDIAASLCCLFVCIVVLLVFGRRIFFVSFDEIGFRVAGFNVHLVDFIILSLVTVTVVVAMPAVGSILSIALIVGPAAGAIRVVDSFWHALFLAPFLGIFTGCLGLWSSIVFGLSSGGMITIFCGITYFICVVFRFCRDKFLLF